MSTGRALNGGCYIFSGLVIAILAIAGGSAPWQVWLLALVALAYGSYILFTRRSYWVTSYTYVIPFLAIAVGIGMLAH